MEKSKMSLIIGVCIVITLLAVSFGIFALCFNGAKRNNDGQQNDKTGVIEKVDEEVKNTENTEKDNITKNEEKAETKTEEKNESKTEPKTETKTETSSEVKKEETTEAKTLEEAIEKLKEAREQMKKVSEALKNQTTAAFDGKTVTGTEVIAACQQYENSELSIKIYVSRDKSFQTGKYAVKLVDSIPTEPKIGGIEVESTGSIYEELGRNTTNLKKDSVSDIEGDVSMTQTYYSYTMKDKSTGTVIGVLFVKKGI